MTPGGYTVEVTGLSPNATEKDVYDFFAFSGAIEHVEIIRYFSDYPQMLFWLETIYLKRRFTCYKKKKKKRIN